MLIIFCLLIRKLFDYGYFDIVYFIYGGIRMRKDSRWIALIFLVTFILLFRLFYDIRLYGHDTAFHTGNIIYLSKTISITNIFGSNLVKYSINKFGYGTWLFYPKLPHLLGAYVYLIFHNVYLSMNIVYFITSFLSGVILFYLSKKIFNNRRVAFLSSVVYLTYSYHICEIYTRDAFAENFMFMVIPLIFLGLFELKDDNTNKFYLYFILGYIIGMYSHLISMVFCTIFVFLFIIFYRKIYLRKDKLKKLIISTLVVTGIVIPALITIIEHRLLGNYVVFSEFFSNRFNTGANVISVVKYLNNSKNAIFNNILVYINLMVFLMIVVTTIVFFFKSYRNKYTDIRKMLFFGILICISFINSHWLWEHIPDMFITIQFPWRIMTFFSIIVSLYAPLLFINCYKYVPRFIINITYVVITIIVVMEGVNNIYYYGEKEYSYKEIVNSYGVLGWSMEYLPNSALELFYMNQLGFIKDFENNYRIISNDDKVLINVMNDDFPNIKFKIDGVSNDTKIVIPRIYYLGYVLSDSKNNKYKLYESNKGFLETKVRNNGIYILKYSGTIYDKISRIIRLVTIFIVVIGGVKLWKRKV